MEIIDIFFYHNCHWTYNFTHKNCQYRYVLNFMKFRLTVNFLTGPVPKNKNKLSISLSRIISRLGELKNSSYICNFSKLFLHACYWLIGLGIFRHTKRRGYIDDGVYRVCHRTISYVPSNVPPRILGVQSANANTSAGAFGRIGSGSVLCSLGSFS